MPTAKLDLTVGEVHASGLCLLRVTCRLVFGEISNHTSEVKLLPEKSSQRRMVIKGRKKRLSKIMLDT